ncbi:HNH nuclease [uncultured Caudovirales phage]|uniref:HNH nuclease n=1 Tax=uncultured Caudovirales phage TaxID=2100421 RepID=A0A6J5P5I4_9CAUD|nr:HNH nuclease [uncultured Caudovirales phage]CAB4218749.1 HNH nuclease [uncultured Caudovirales phage]
MIRKGINRRSARRLAKHAGDIPLPQKRTAWLTRGMSISQKINFYSDKSGGPTACWPWTGYKFANGYPGLEIHGRLHVATRLLWQEIDGRSLPRKELVCHRCDNPTCMNPDHHFLGTHKENMADRATKGRQARGTKNGSAKITERIAQQIYTAPGNHSDIGDTFGISKTQVSAIKAGKYWAHAIPKNLGKSAVSKKPWKSREHLDRVKAEPCLFLSNLHVVPHCDGPMDPHHCRKLLPAGLLPRHDALTVPLCRRHHKMMDGDERALWKALGINPAAWIASFSAEGAAEIARILATPTRDVK